MKVYVVTGEYIFDSTDILGVFSTKELGDKCKLENNKYDSVNVIEWEVDKPKKD